jgi:hypothetical protein
MWNRNIFVIIVLALLTCGANLIPDVVTQSNEGVSITSPTQDEILLGVVPIVGTSEIAGFVSAEVAFAYATGSPGTWFPISMSNQGVEAGLLTSWDTTSITDGDYRLRLRVVLEDGSIQEFVISRVHIRNYTPTETPVPSATPVSSNPTAAMHRTTMTPVIVPTGLPENPLVLSPTEIFTSVIYGVVAIFGLIVISGIYSRWQHK